MQKSILQKAGRFLFSSLGRGLAAFAVFGLATAVYAITYPAQPNAVTGVVGIYVGSTPATYDGNAATSYAGADAFCDAQYSDSHVCRMEEVINTYTHDSAAVSGVVSIAWVNSGAGGVAENMVNDCQGWAQADAPYFARVWNFSDSAAAVQECSSVHAFACCK